MILCVNREGDALAIRAFGVVRYARIGLVSCASIFGRDVYKRVDSVRWLFGIIWGQ
jgi:hypothetical protein